ncbi:TPA: hypothetical protein ACXJF2_000461 [Serratia marcescens]
MNISKIAILFIICQSLSGCGLAQRMELDKQYKEQQKESVFSTAGIKALEYVIQDDKIIAAEGGESLCPDGCSLKNVIDKANSSPLGVTAFYTAIHDYNGKSPSLYKIDDPAVRYTTMTEVLNRFSSVFGSSSLSEESHISELYRDFTKDRELLGLTNIGELDFKNSVGELYKRRNELVVMISSMRDQARDKASKITQNRTLEYDKANPEVQVTGIGDLVYSGKAAALRNAINRVPFVTRAPNTPDTRQIYVKVGGVKLTLSQIDISIREQLTDCQRISAYSGLDIDSPCLNLISKGVLNFSAVIENRSIPDLTKRTALGEATFGRVIDFDHAARLAKMHYEMCSRKNNAGYVAMVTVAVPCNGRGDVLYISAAEKAGLL